MIKSPDNLDNILSQDNFVCSLAQKDGQREGNQTYSMEVLTGLKPDNFLMVNCLHKHC